jgi:hypothetical protein
VITASLTDIIAQRLNFSEQQAMEELYSSELYKVLEQEDTKVWYYSVPMLYELFKRERENGILLLPDY